MTSGEKKHKQKQKAHKKHQCSNSHFIGHYEDAPLFMKDNQHITHGYRIGFDTPKKILRSLFMVHNESVNIWSHFLPAIILFCLIFYLMVFVGPATIMNDLSVRKQKFTEGLKSYSDALGNLTFVLQMKQLKEKTDVQMEEIKQSVINSYSVFRKQLQTFKINAQQKFSSLQNKISHPLWELESLKDDFQNIFVPNIVNGVIDKIDSQSLQSLSKRLSKIKTELDSQKYDYIELSSKQVPNPHLVSRWPVFVFLFSAVICLMCSATFHLFYPMSGRAYQMFSRMDYAGINILISGSAFPALYYGMYCQFNLVIFYLTIICLLGATLFVISLFEYLHRPENFKLKSMAYGGFGISLAIPLTHAMVNQLVFHNYGDMFSMSQSIGYYILCGFFYLFGLWIYTVRCPERHRPGKFNVCGNSHQIWHSFVVLGILATYFGALTNLETRKMHVCPVL